MIVQHNLSAMNANRQINIVTNTQAASTEKLSSGFKINRAADDAAGLAISEKMRRQIRGLTQASNNAQDGISLIQTAEGGLNEVHDMIQRLNELSNKASNGTLTDIDRGYLDSEFAALKKEINRVAGSTTFNEIQLFPPDGSGIYTSEFNIKVNADGTHTVTMLSDTYTVGTPTATANAEKLATYIAGQIPGIMGDLKTAFPSLTGAEDLEIALNLSFIDGGNGTLAYAAYSYYPNGDGTGTPVKSSFMVKVDTADFTDSNGLAGGDRNDLLMATLRHELTHTIMQYNLPTMPSLPDWFVEGSAQVSGGGYSTGWLTDLMGNKTEAEVSDYLKTHTVDGQPYGHGFLATAYAARLAEGDGTVDADKSKILSGLNKIFAEMKNNGETFEQAIKKLTGKTTQQIKDAINNGETGTGSASAFVKAYNDASRRSDGTYGAGSALLASFDTGESRMGAVPADGSTASDLMAANEIILQVGSEAGHDLKVDLFSIGTNSLGLSNANIQTQDAALNAIDCAKNALGVVSAIRSYYGATQNRLEHTIKNLDNVVENTTSAESSIRDTDMATEMVKFSNENILSQAGISMLAQANQTNQNVLSLLQ